MMKKDIIWIENGWIALQDADAEKHLLGITIHVDDAKVTEVRIRHNDGEEAKGTVLLDGENALPMALADFKKYYLKDAFEIR